MRTAFCKSPSPSRALNATPPVSPPRHTFSDTLMEENIENAEGIIKRWSSESSVSSHCNVESLFNINNRHEATSFIKSVADLQSAMRYYVSENPGSEKLVRAQILMQAAMKILEKEFYQMLKANRAHLDPESVSTHSSRISRSSGSLSDFEDDSDDDLSRVSDRESASAFMTNRAMADLKTIADCMISAGYAKECVKIYKIIRRSIVDEALYVLGVERLTFAQIQKLDWDVLDGKIKNWLNAVKVAVKTLFFGERLLCDYVFSSSPGIGESCFSEITKEGALTLFGFPENIAKCKKTPEKMFRTLDLYEAVSELWPEIESIFSFETTVTVRTQAVNSLLRLGDAVRTMLTDFEAAIQKDSSRTPVPGGGVHPLTRYVMNYLAFLADYSGEIADIVADWPLTLQCPLPESYFGSPDSNDGVYSSPVSVRLAWLILVMLCKLDGKAEIYKDVPLAYLFLANNLQYVVVKVRTSNLRLLLGDAWLSRHEAKVKQYAANYERMGWGKVLTSLPENPDIPLEQAKTRFRTFNAAFEEAYKKQSSWVVPDSKLRDEIKLSLARKLVPTYREFYERYRVGLKKETWSESLVRFAPDDLGNYLSDLFFGNGGPGSVSSCSSASSSPGHSRGGRSN
ncbi:exocyst complex component EXO70H1-like [Carica papaya]|uniref:exocyst complex component EXO70H1-like n=1 Tax=Carica papaya TaxID=3649 RepID=UPI000B8D0275|nr:exocyst complex component EXO70H1-like [Carica papaya]